MNHLTKVKYIQKLNEEELRKGVPINASWHTKYRDSAYVYVGGFPYELTEGDLVIIFSQYGEIVDCRIVRDKETGKSKGFGFICYEDQRSTILAVDNLNGADICGRIIRVDHVEKYKIPREYFESDEIDENGENKIYKPSGPDGKGWGEDRILSSADLEHFENLKKLEIEKENRRNNIQNDNNLVLDSDEKWEKEFLKMITETKKEEEKIQKKKESKKKKKKEEKKSRKERKERKKEKEQKKKEKSEEELKELYKSYGINNVK